MDGALIDPDGTVYRSETVVPGAFEGTDGRTKLYCFGGYTVAMADSTSSAVRRSRVIGVLLIALGVGAWVFTAFASMTALIPAVFGGFIIGLLAVGRSTNRERLAVYGVGLLGALGVLGSLRAVPELVAVASGGEIESATALAAQGSMIVFGLLLVAISTRVVLETR